jgi:hypothetical protein
MSTRALLCMSVSTENHWMCHCDTGEQPWLWTCNNLHFAVYHLDTCWLRRSLIFFVLLLFVICVVDRTNKQDTWPMKAQIIFIYISLNINSIENGSNRNKVLKCGLYFMYFSNIFTEALSSASWHRSRVITKLIIYVHKHRYAYLFVHAWI